MSTQTRRLLAFACLCATALSGYAMSVIAPTFDQLVAKADYVVRGVVTDVHCITVDTPQGQGIQTLVALHVERVLKGSPGSDVTLTFLGGKVGHRTLTVVGMPKFTVGQREIVFVANNGQAICPLIAAGHGRYHVRHDAALNRDYIERENGAPLASTADISQPLEASTASGTATRANALTSEAFETQISAAVRVNQAQQP